MIDWMWVAFWAWFGWYVLAPATAFVTIMILALLLILIRAIRQARCEHVKYFENRACHAVCSACRKDLGFIGAVREQRAAQKGDRQ